MVIQSVVKLLFISLLLYSTAVFASANAISTAKQLVEQNNYSKAVEVLKNDIRKSRKKIDSVIYLSDIYYKSGEFSIAREILDEYRNEAVNEDNEEYFLQRAKIEAGSGDFESSLAFLKDGLNSLENHSKIESKISNVYFRLGLQYLAKNDAKTANYLAPIISAAVNADSFKITTILSSKDLFNKLTKEIRSNDYDGFVSNFSEIPRLSPGYLFGLFFELKRNKENMFKNMKIKNLNGKIILYGDYSKKSIYIVVEIKEKSMKILNMSLI